MAKIATGPPASSGPEEGRSMRSTTDSANRKQIETHKLSKNNKDIIINIYKQSILTGVSEGPVGK